jgi:hydrogenase expression/formation protein HypE
MEKKNPTIEGAVCPVPLAHTERIIMGHGSGGRMSHDLIQKLFLPIFNSPALNSGDDGAILPIEHLQTSQHLVVSTDSHVVTPLFFPGGDIGRLSVCGTVNDIAMMGATPLYLTSGFIIEEGFEISLLNQIVQSMQSAAEEAGVSIIAGDTKVVQKGKADGVYINTAGFGFAPPEASIFGSNAQPGDAIILSGTIGDHGIAVLSARGDLGLTADVESDVAPLNHMVDAMLKKCQSIHVLRDPTRGGVATTLNEIALQSRVSMLIHESAIPVHSAVRATCEMLGFDPLYVANEGKLIAVVPAEDANRVLEAMHESSYGHNATIIGSVTEKSTGRVLLKTTLGTHRVIDMLAGEILPRIC